MDIKNLENWPENERDLMLQALMRHIPDMIYFKDTQSRFRAVNQAMLGRLRIDKPEQALGKSDADFFTLEHARAALEDEQAILASGESVVNKEEKETWADGHVSWVSTTKVPLRDEDGRIIGTFGISRDITDRVLAQQALEESDRMLRFKHEQMLNELERARMIQQAMLPPRSSMWGPMNIEHWYLPLDAVGGDFISLTPVSEHQLGVLAADVSGHGVSGALFTSLLKFLGDRIADEHGAEPDMFLRRLNKELMVRLPHSFMTAVYVCFDWGAEPGVVRARVAGAGHPFPVLCTAATGESALVPLKNEGALGIIPQFDTTCTELTLRSGDQLFLYSDGITELTGNAPKMLEEDGLAGIIQQSYQPELSRAMPAIGRAVLAHAQGGAIDDDILLVGCGVRL